MKPRRRYHLNVVGDFYVEDGCCTNCGVPDSIAPDLFGTADQCYVKKQPTTADELSRMVEVVRSQELGCVRYGGSDRQIIGTLCAAGEARQCDRSWVQRILTRIRHSFQRRSA